MWKLVARHTYLQTNKSLSPCRLNSIWPFGTSAQLLHLYAALLPHTSIQLCQKQYHLAQGRMMGGPNMGPLVIDMTEQTHAPFTLNSVGYTTSAAMIYCD